MTTQNSQSAALLFAEIIGRLHEMADEDNVAGMARYGISTHGTLGVKMPSVRALAREARRSVRREPETRHRLAGLLWESTVHEARIMASLIDDPRMVDAGQRETWISQVDSWDICDLLCNNLLRLTLDAWDTAEQWTRREHEFTKRAGFVLVATLAVHDKGAPDSHFIEALNWIERESCDERDLVKKGVNWALRQIGKRSGPLNTASIESAERILAAHPDCPPARWIARDALRELKSDAIRKRLGLA